MRRWLAVCFVAAFGNSAFAGPYLSFDDPAGQVLPSEIRTWARWVEDYSPAPGVGALYNNPAAGLHGANGGIVSLGDLDETQINAGTLPGSITLRMGAPIVDGPGADFAVFENAGTFFTSPYVFGELAFVEVSSNGTDFARFENDSLNIEPDGNGTLDPNEIDVPFGRDFAAIDSTNVHNLAGIHPTGIGTPFDLSELAGDPLVTSSLVDLGDIQYVRLVDIPGGGAFTDTSGDPILDTWVTVGSGGFDLDAVGVINTVPEPNAMVLVLGLVGIGVTVVRLY